MRVVVTADNSRQVSAVIKHDEPELHDLLKQVHSAGMIDGLRSLRDLELGGFEVEPVVEVVVEEVKHYCRECAYWRRDEVGLGAGIGECLGGDRRPFILHWPEQVSCCYFVLSGVV